MSEDRCVCCGDIIPEGRQVCPGCEIRTSGTSKLSEKYIERRLREEIQKEGGLCLKWVCPGWAGVPDRICLIPEGRIAFVELKTVNGTVSDRQKWWRKKLTSLGFSHFIVKSTAEIYNFMEWLRSEEE